MPTITRRSWLALTVPALAATTVAEVGLDVGSMATDDGSCCIIEVMGRSAGWIAAGTVLAKRGNPANPPHIALRIQQLYGVNTTPRIAMNRVPVLVHILAPSQRPVQITQDLPRFWREHYPKIKQELQRKYPKHEWR